MKKYLFKILITLLFSSFIVSCNFSSNDHPKINHPDPNKMIIHYIDVEQGDSILIQVNNKNLLIDAGPKSSKEKLLNYLSKLGLDKLDYVIATHPHEDHIGNMADIIYNYKVLSFYAPKIQSTTKTFENLICALKDKNLKINVLKKNTNSIYLGKNTKFIVFSPTKNSYEDLNNYSPVIKIEYGKTSFLFTGDIQKEIEQEILDNNEDISSDILKIAHHGSDTSTSIDFLSKVNPSIGVISVGQDNMYNHPSKDTIKNLTSKKVTLYRTDKDGTIILSSDGSKINKE